MKVKKAPSEWRGSCPYMTAKRLVCPGTIFIAKMSMTCRGACLSWLSQYPHEIEFIYPALCAMETRDINEAKDGRIMIDMDFSYKSQISVAVDDQGKLRYFRAIMTPY